VNGFSDMRWLLSNSVMVFSNVLYVLIMGRVLCSWLIGNSGSKIKEFFYVLTEPFLGPIRSMIGRSPLGGGMMLDFSPVIALFLIQILRTIIINVIYSVF